MVLLFAPQLISLFSNDLQVIELGAKYLRIEGIFYILIGFLFLFYGFYRGLGHAGMSIVLTVVSLGTRVVLAYSLASTILGYSSIFWSIPIGWLLADIVGFIAYRHWRRGTSVSQTLKVN